MTRLPPTWARTAATCSSTMFASVHSGRQPAPSYRNRSSTCWPAWVCSTSGWNWTPNRPRATSSNAATGLSGVDAVTANPGGAAETASPCDIHTVPVPPNPSTPPPPSTDSGVRPNSDRPVRATVPPSACAIAWKP